MNSEINKISYNPPLTKVARFVTLISDKGILEYCEQKISAFFMNEKQILLVWFSILLFFDKRTRTEKANKKPYKSRFPDFPKSLEAKSKLRRGQEKN